MIGRLDPYKVYLIVTAVSAFAFATAFTTSAVYRYEVAGLDPLQLVLLGTALEASIFVFEIPTGVVADRYSRRLSVIIGYGMIGLGMLLEGALPLFATVLLAQLVWGVGYTFISGAESAWLADEVGEDRLTAVYLRGSQAAQIATLAGIGANIMLANIQLNLPYYLGGLGHVLLAVFLALFMPERGFSPTPQEERTTWHELSSTFRSGMRTIRMRPLLITMMAISFFYGLYSEALDRLWQPQFLDNVSPTAPWGLDAVTWFGILSAAILVITVVTAEIARRRYAGASPRQLTLVLAALSAIISIGLLIFGLAARLPLAVFAYGSVAISRRTLGPFFDAWTNRGIPSAVRATVLSTFGQMDAIGQVTGGPAVGIIANTFGLRAAFVAAGLLLTPVLILYRRAYRQAEDFATVETPA